MENEFQKNSWRKTKMSKPRIIDQGKNVIPRVECAKCGQQLKFKEWNDKRGVPYIDTSKIIWNYCPMCGEKIEGYENE